MLLPQVNDKCFHYHTLLVNFPGTVSGRMYEHGTSSGVCIVAIAGERGNGDG